jgi:pimeloyl-ACP methyl ester carboxylesterase
VNGRRPTVLAIHGQPGTGRDFGAVARALDGQCGVVAPDRPGWGDRAGEPAGGFAAGADDALVTLDRAGVDRAIVLGFSWGGGVALELTRRHPDRVGALVLAASIGPGEPTALDRMLALPGAGPAICAGGLAATRLALRRSAFHGLLGRGMRGIDPNHVRRFADDCLSPAALAGFMVEQRALVREFPGVVRALSVRVPTIVVTGERDRLIAPGSARRLAEAITGAELRTVPGAGHFLPSTAAGALADAVMAVAARAGSADW